MNLCLYLPPKKFRNSTFSNDWHFETFCSYLILIRYKKMIFKSLHPLSTSQCCFSIMPSQHQLTTYLTILVPTWWTSSAMVFKRDLYLLLSFRIHLRLDISILMRHSTFLIPPLKLKGGLINNGRFVLFFPLI